MAGKHVSGSRSGYLLLLPHQPVHRLFPRLEGHNLALGKGPEVFHEGVRDALRADPRRLLHERTVERQHFFNPGGHRVIHRGTGKIGERDERFPRVLRHRDPHILQQKLHLVGIGMRKVQQQNLLALMLDESYAIIHSGRRIVFPVFLCCEKAFTPETERSTEGIYFNNESTMLYTPASAESSAATSLPPASARLERPPPLPPTFSATTPTTLPA